MQALKKYLHAARKVEREYHRHPLPIKGRIPEALQGTLFRNGNGRFEHQGVTYKHLFDGDGMITKFAFRDGAIHYSNRYVYTREFVEENRAGRMLYRSFGTNLPGGPLKNLLKMRFKNAANTSLIRHGGTLLALWEGGLPHGIDPATLDTLGRFDYGGVLQNDFSTIDRWINPELPFSAHPKVHPDTGVLHNFGTAAGTKQRLLLYEVQPDGQAAISQVVPLDEVTFTHDFVLTHRGRKVFFLTPVAFDLFRAFSGLDAPVASMRIDRSRRTTILVVDRDRRVRRLETDFCFVFHFANGYDVGEEKLIVDGYIMEDFPSAESVQSFVEGEPTEGPMPRLMRFELDLTGGKVERSPLSAHPGELPGLPPAREGLPYRYVWSIAAPPETRVAILNGLAKVDTQERKTLYKDLAPHFPGEPVFVPKPGARAEDEGWLLMLLFDSEALRTRLLILDARDLSEVASAELPHNIPLGFHGFWTEESW